jgi:thiol-disulfide isomerase/thioredoxin
VLNDGGRVNRRIGLTVAWFFLTVSAAFAEESHIRPIDARQFDEVLEAQKGQVVLVNFWATWCRPCLKEIPEISALADDLMDRGFTLVPVSLDDPDDLHTLVVPFLNKWFPEFSTYTRLEPQMDAMVSVIDSAWNEILPTSYVLDRDGKRVATIQGGKSRNDFEALILPLLD